MIRTALSFTAGVIATLALTFLLDMQMEEAPAVSSDSTLEESLDELAEAVREAGEFVRGHLWYGSEPEQVEAYRHIVRQLGNAIRGRALTDPDFPFIHVIDTRSKAGMGNADQRYLDGMLDGDAVYRVWGTRGTSTRPEFSA